MDRNRIKKARGTLALCGASQLILRGIAPFDCDVVHAGMLILRVQDSPADRFRKKIWKWALKKERPSDLLRLFWAMTGDPQIP